RWRRRGPVRRRPLYAFLRGASVRHSRSQRPVTDLLAARLAGVPIRGQLSDGDESVRRTGVHRGIVCAEVIDGSETVANKDRLELASRPAPHDEPIVARMFAGGVDQRVRFGQKKLMALRIELRGARERQRASVRRNGLSKQRLTLLPVPRRLPFANVENQD